MDARVYAARLRAALLNANWRLVQARRWYDEQFPASPPKEAPQ
jgi:hypothetical protein